MYIFSNFRPLCPPPNPFRYATDINQFCIYFLAYINQKSARGIIFSIVSFCLIYVALKQQRLWSQLALGALYTVFQQIKL